MLFIFAAIAVAASAATAAPAAPADSAAPLREVVYKVSYTHHQSITTGTYGGYAAGADNVGGANGGAPVSQRADISDEGTITVDVMAEANNALGIKLTESWRQHPRAQIFQGEVAPDGSVNFGGQPISEASLELLPFFGPLVSNGQTLDVGVKWTTNADSPAGSMSTNYVIKSIDDNGVTIQETKTIKVKGAVGMDSTINGSVVYFAPKLVPISGKIVRHSSKSGASDSNTDEMIINFDRTSDTLDPAH